MKRVLSQVEERNVRQRHGWPVLRRRRILSMLLVLTWSCLALTLPGLAATIEEARAQIHRSATVSVPGAAPTRAARTAFIEAARRGQVKAVRAALARGLSPNVVGAFGDSALWAAVEEGHEPVVQALVAADANVNLAENSRRITPLMSAASVCRPSMAELLLARGAQVDAATVDGWTPLMFAAAQGCTGVIRQLLTAGAAINAMPGGRSALMCAAANGRVDAVTELMAQGADANQGSSEGGWTALMMGMSYPDTVRALVAAGAALDRMNDDGRTAWDLAFRHHRRYDSAEILVDAGARVSLHEPVNIERMMAAAADGHFGLVRKLLRAHGDWNVATREGRTALMAAAEAGELELVIALIRDGADVDRTDLEGRTALTYAAVHGQVFAAAQLVAAGARTDVSAWDGRTPLSEARLSDEIRELLTRAGKSDRAKERTGESGAARPRDSESAPCGHEAQAGG